MPTVIYVQPDGAEQRVDVPAGYTIMEAARDADVPGIAAECGGACSCATCHVYLAPNWFGRAGAVGPMEEEMLESADGRNEYSRLSCQIRMQSDLDGIRVNVPAH